jgi:hydroxymethylglutaryl-CoA lyase
MDRVVLTDCPRDAIQGLHDFISTEKKVEHVKTLMASSVFDRIDFGSFVSAKAVPQMRDTAAVAEALAETTGAELLAIVLNVRGAEEALRYENIAVLGFPFSISPTFQLRNGNSTVEAAFDSVKEIQEKVEGAGRKLEVYLSMAFGNPYGDEWDEERVLGWLNKLQALGIREFSLADTTGSSEAVGIDRLFRTCFSTFPGLSLGAHFHAAPGGALEKVQAAYMAGCRKFDGALLGYGGCPFAQDSLVGNVPSEDLLRFFQRSDELGIARLQDSFRTLIS